MKIIHLLVIAAFAASLFSSCATSYVPCMPSEPTFTNALQAQATVGVAFDHIEEQAAVSVLPFLGFTGDYYAGAKGIKQYEYGANLFTPLNKEKSLFISLGAGKGEGTFKGNFSTDLLGYSHYQVNTEFSSLYIQPSIYYVLETAKNNSICKLSLSIKHEEIYFKYMNMALHRSSGLSAATYSIYARKQNGFAIINTPFLGLSLEGKDHPVYFHAQLGMRNITKSFNVTVTHILGGTDYGDALKQVTNALHPLFSPYMFNTTLGFKLDYFRVKNKRKTKKLNL